MATPLDEEQMEKGNVIDNRYPIRIEFTVVDKQPAIKDNGTFNFHSNR